MSGQEIIWHKGFVHARRFKNRNLSRLPNRRQAGIYQMVQKWMGEDVYDSQLFNRTFDFSVQTSIKEDIRKEVDWYLRESVRAEPFQDVTLSRFRDQKCVQKKRGDTVMPIANDYAILSDDGKTLILPTDAQTWMKGKERFIVVLENENLIFRRVYTQRSLHELVLKTEVPLTESDLNTLIHESRQ